MISCMPCCYEKHVFLRLKDWIINSAHMLPCNKHLKSILLEKKCIVPNSDEYLFCTNFLNKIQAKSSTKKLF